MLRRQDGLAVGVETRDESACRSDGSNLLGLADELSRSGVDFLVEGDAAEAVLAFRGAIDADPHCMEAHHGLIRALGDAGELEAAIEAARVLTALTPADPLAQTSLSIALQQAGKIPEAEAAAGRARILEWKQQLETPAGE